MTDSALVERLAKAVASPMTRPQSDARVRQRNGKPLMRFRVVDGYHDDRWDIKAGDIVLCEEMHWAWADEKVASVRRESDGYEPGCSFYRDQVEFLGYADRCDAKSDYHASPHVGCILR